MNTDKNTYNLGVALSGGGAKGFAHLGVLQALNEKGLYPDISTAPTKSNNNDEVMLKILHALELNNETMQDIKRTGLRANIEKSAQNGKSIEEMIEDYNRNEGDLNGNATDNNG